MDQKTKLDISKLLNIARPKLVAADNGGGSKMFNEVSGEFGTVAHRVYLALDLLDRSPEKYHNVSAKRVLLDPHTVLNRSRTYGIRDTEITLDSPEFWNHGDMIKTLIDYIALAYPQEAHYVPSPT